MLFDNDKALAFDSIDALATKDFSGKLKQFTGWRTNIITSHDGRYYPQHNSQLFKNETAFSAQGTLHRTRTIAEYLARGAAVVCVEFDNAAAPFGVKNRFCEYDHIQLVRLVVFPEQERKEL